MTVIDEDRPAVAGRLMEGAEAFAEAMVSAGCRFFAGYPMTPFTELLENMSRLLPGVGGVCMNAESEIEAVGMAWGASAAGARAATGSVGQGLSLMQESLSEICRARLPLVVINMARGQGDYFQATRGGGHGDYRHIVLAPSDSPEASYLVQLAFHLSDVWRNPVLVFGDYYLNHVIETVDTSLDPRIPAEGEKSWSLDGTTGGSFDAKLLSPVNITKDNSVENHYGELLVAAAERMRAMEREVEPMVETGFTEDAELIVVAYGTPARYVRYIVGEMRKQGIPVGFVRPITLWPYPTEALAAAVGPKTKKVAVYELNAGQMIEDVRLAVLGRVPIVSIGGISFDSSGFGIAPDMQVDIIEARIRAAMDSSSKENA